MEDSFIVELSLILNEFENGNYDYGLNLLKDFEKKSINFDEKIEIARIYINLGLIENAKEILNALENVNNTSKISIEISRTWAELYFYEGDNERTLNYLYDIDKKDYCADDYALISQIYFKEGLPEVAYKYICMALEEDNEDASYHYQKGVYAYELGEISEARLSFQKAISIDEDEQLFYLALGETLYYAGEFEDALVLYDKVLALEPNQEDALYLKGLVLVSIENIEEGIVNLERALKINPNNIEILETLFKAYEIANNKSGSINILYQILAIDEHHLPSLKKLADIYINNNDINNAKEIIFKALEIDPYDESILHIQNNILKLENNL